MVAETGDGAIERGANLFVDGHSWVLDYKTRFGKLLKLLRLSALAPRTAHGAASAVEEPQLHVSSGYLTNFRVRLR
jgi:hypothetical protein